MEEHKEYKIKLTAQEIFELKDYHKGINKDQLNFLFENPNNTVSLTNFLSYTDKLSKDSLQLYYSKLDNQLKNSKNGIALKNSFEIQKIKYEYAKKQFGATIMAVFSGELSATLNFAPLYAIQSAPFMMTLVRKGKCNSTHYHIVYAFTLIYPLYLYPGRTIQVLCQNQSMS